MNDFSDALPDRDDHSNHGRLTSPELDILLSHPSLRGLAGRGWQLDRLPITSTAWSVTATILASIVIFGAANACLVVGMTMVVMVVTGCALPRGRVRVVRSTLHLLRVCLVVWVLAGAAGTLLSGGPASAAPAPPATGYSGTTNANKMESLVHGMVLLPYR
jgi:hypothetical protein